MSKNKIPRVNNMKWAYKLTYIDKVSSMEVVNLISLKFNPLGDTPKPVLIIPLGMKHKIYILVIKCIISSIKVCLLGNILLVCGSLKQQDSTTDD